MSEYNFQQVGGDSIPKAGADWYSPDLGFVKLEVVEGENGHRADIHFLERDWHEYQIHPNRRLDEAYWTSLVNDPNEVVRMVGAAVLARKSKEEADKLTPFELACQVQGDKLLDFPVFQ